MDPFARGDYAQSHMPSFDIASKPNWSEIDNALIQDFLLYRCQEC